MVMKKIGLSSWIRQSASTIENDNWILCITAYDVNSQNGGVYLRTKTGATCLVDFSQNLSPHMGFSEYSGPYVKKISKIK